MIAPISTPASHHAWQQRHLGWVATWVAHLKPIFFLEKLKFM